MNLLFPKAGSLCVAGHVARVLKCGVSALALAAATVMAGTEGVEVPRNILWDGAFHTGFGNGFWTTQLGNMGPSRRDAWSEQGINLKGDVCSRVYPLEEGTYALCAWVKRSPASPESASQVVLELTNLNYYGDGKKSEGGGKKLDSYFKKFEMPAGDGWQRVGWTFEIKAPVRNHFHVEVKGAEGKGEGILVREVALIKGTVLPDKVLPASDVEAGFDVTDETRTYVDGEERVVDLVATRVNGPAKAQVKWEVFNHREELVKNGVADFDFPVGGGTLRQRIPLQDLPYGGYRLASSVEGQAVLGDALVAFLPKLDFKATPYFGADANITRRSMPYAARLMTRLGMQTANALSCSGGLCRWVHVNPEKGRYAFNEEDVRQAHDAGLEIIMETSLFKSPPKWVREQFMGEKDEIKDEKGYTEAGRAMLDAMIHKYGRNMAGLIMDDEVNTFTKPGEMDQFRRIYSAFYVAAKKAAADIGKPDMPVGINATQPEWWASFVDNLPLGQADTVSSNSNLRPETAANLLNTLRSKNIFPKEYRTIGVGQKSQMRSTSLYLDRASGGGDPPGLFVWQFMAHSWMSRPYGSGNVKDGPIVHYGYYDLRMLAQSAYMPQAGKSGIEFDNSPTLGSQGMAMFKYQTQGMDPVRDPAKPFSAQGLSTGNPRFFAYPFRDKGHAVIVLSVADAHDFDSEWKLSGVDFSKWKPFDLYAQPIPVKADSSIVTKDIPIYLHVEAGDLDAALKNLSVLKAEMTPKSDKHTLEVGHFILEIDPAREGGFALMRKQGDRKVIILDRVAGNPALSKPSAEVTEGRASSSAMLIFGDSKKGNRLAFNLTPEGCTITWASKNGHPLEVKQTIRLRVNIAGAGRPTVIQEGVNVRAGRTREDYGEFFPDAQTPAPATLPSGAARVEIKDFATFELPPPKGKGFAPDTGFLWKTQDGEAWLAADYTIAAYKGGGSRGVQDIELKVVVK